MLYDGYRFDCIVPVPLRKDSALKRGFNQSLIVARALEPHVGARSVCDILIAGDRSPQSSRSQWARRKDSRKMFRLAKLPHVGAHILLVDDVMTTGTTVEAAARVLLEGGAGSVSVLTLAKSHLHT
jgi:ComF family protein